MNTRLCVAGLSALLCAAIALPAAAKPPRAQPEPAAAPEPAPVPEAAPPAPVPAAPGVLVLAADADGLVAEVSGAVVGLKKGDNRFDLPAGSAKVLVKTAAGKVVHESVAVIPSAGEERVTLVTLGKVEMRVPAQAKVLIDGKEVPATAGACSADLEPGTHSLLVTGPGHVGKKGSFEIESGKKAAIAAVLDVYNPPGHEDLAWAGMIGGGALIVAALVIEGTTKFDQLGGDAVRWSLLGVGTAGFVGGTLLLKSSMDEAATPPVLDGKFDIKVSQIRGGAMTRLGMRF